MENLELFDFCRRLGMDGEAAAVCRENAWEPQAVLEAYRLLYGCPDRFFHWLCALEGWPQRSLGLFVQFAQMARPVYRQWEIPDEVYWATFADIALWEREYFQRNGVHGLGEVQWVAFHVRMEIFRLGSLQFQPQRDPLEAEWKNADISGEDMVLHVHIPKGADLSPEAVKESYARALDFWKCSRAVLLCDSWLLSPQLDGLLPRGSRIREFAAGFSIVAADETSRQAEERIFGEVRADPREYPENGTSLQKAARAHLLAGKTIPAGYGWQRIERVSR